MNNNNNNYEIDFEKAKPFIKKIIIVAAIFIGLLIVFNMFTYTVDEAEQVVVKQFNEAIKIIIEEDNLEMKEERESNNNTKDINVIVGRKGLFFKIPFLQTIEKYTVKLLTYDTPQREVTTKDLKLLELDNFAQWKIKDPALFISTLQTESQARQRLDEIVYSKMNEEIGKVDAHVVISDKEYVLEMLKKIVIESNEQLKSTGIEVIDIRIKRTNLPEENYENVFSRMEAERERSAKTYRSEGLEEAQIIRSQADKEKTIIEAEAYKTAEEIKGEGDAEALKIYAEAYNQDPEFYAFWRTLEAYKKTLKDNTTIVITPDSEFAKYLYKPGGDQDK